MEQVPELAALFLSHTRGRFAPPADPTAIQLLLIRSWETARAQWQTVDLPATRFVHHVARRLPEKGSDSPLEQLLEQLSLAELYLACACVHGVPSAIECFDRNYLSKLPGMLRGPGQSAAMIDDICQQARLKLLVPTPEGEARIAEYTGRGSLLSWVRVTAVRMALKARAVQKPGQEEDGDIPDIPAPEFDPEAELIRRRYHADFRQAMRESFAALAADERHLLRLYFVDQLSSYELASLFRVNQGTISRRMKAARQTVYEETRRRLHERLGLSTRDFKSFLAVLDSQFQVSISQLLGEEDAAPRPPPKRG